MLHSQKEERGRRFTLALRAGIPVLILTFLVFFSTIDKEAAIKISTKDGILLTAITFIAIYFIYFLMNLSVQETLLDITTQTFTKKAFIKNLEDYHPDSLGCLSIENLPLLNENYSSDQVDTLLYSISKSLNLLFKQNGIKNVLIGRNRGSEFLIALNENYEQIHAVLETMVTQNRRINNIEVEYRFAIITNTHQDYNKAILQLRDLIAGQSLEDEKEENHVTLKDAKELSDSERDVITALKEQKLSLSFRALLNVRNDTVDTYEIAVKLKSHTTHDILPRVFLPIVNRLGLGREYDWVLIKHIIDLLPLVDEGISFTFNLSPFSLRDSTFQEKLFTTLDTSNIDASRLIIQLYERKTHHDLGGYLSTLKSYRAKGLRICIDNFGSSNASLEYMKHFKFDIVQFDRDYSTNLDDDTTHTMLYSLVKMLRELNVQTVAKWVDSPSQKKKLIKLGIDYIQGFGVNKPLTEEELIAVYDSSLL
jgi:EAL domain-containing protein (putative c-di-GMP-specific phosphodiesterase class I)